MFDFGQPQARKGGCAILTCNAQGKLETNYSLEELGELVRACGLDPVSSVTTSRLKPDPAYFIGSGKLAELKVLCDKLAPDVVAFGNELSTAQIRNLERALGRRVADRVMLIIEIFANRAKSFEGKLQVEVARCHVELSKLAGYWTHLERQRNARGALGGPGEKQIEIDRRILQKRISRLNKSLGKCMNQTRMQKRLRQRRGVPTVGLVGYTNAGKSTLLNALTGRRDAVASNRMFETLDSLSRRIRLADGGTAIVTDTVGFMRNLPHELIAAFHATLAETADADLLLHVVDASSPDAEQQIAAVEGTLERNVDGGKKPRLLVWNKCDRTGASAGMRKDCCGRIESVTVSATSGEGLDCLKSALSEILAGIRPSSDMTLH